MDSVVTDLGEIDPECFFKLYNYLENINIKLQKETDRVGFGKHRCAPFGFVKKREGSHIGISAYTVKYPEIWDEIKTIGRIFHPFKFTSVHLNKDVVCGRHRDKGNTGDSIIVSFGDYEGGNLYTEHGEVYNTNCRAVKFNGREITHWTDEITNGTKYSLVFYTHERVK
jgi:hypothetical protein